MVGKSERNTGESPPRLPGLLCSPFQPFPEAYLPSSKLPPRTRPLLTATILLSAITSFFGFSSISSLSVFTYHYSHFIHPCIIMYVCKKSFYSLHNLPPSLFSSFSFASLFPLPLSHLPIRYAFQPRLSSPTIRPLIFFIFFSRWSLFSRALYHGNALYNTFPPVFLTNALHTTYDIYIALFLRGRI